MEHSTIHPAKTVGDLRAYAQKFKQNQFCFKFLLDEIAANYQVAYQNGCIYVDHLRVINTLNEKLRQTSFWQQQKRKNLKRTISQLCSEELEGVYWCVGLAFYYYCKNSKGDKESFRTEAKDFAVGYLSAGTLLLKKMTNKASFETRQEMDDFLKNNLSRQQYAQLEKVWEKTGFISNESQGIVDDWNELVFVQKMLDRISEHDHYSFECICRQIDVARAKFVNRNPNFSTVLRALKIIYDNTPD